MTAASLFLTRCDGGMLHVLRWSPDGAPRAVVQVAHGMQEHAARYGGLAERLVAGGFEVWADDHRGHGRTARDAAELGRLGPAGWRGVLCDLQAVHAAIAEARPGVPVVLLGHSWGSFLSQAYAQHFGGDLRGLVLCGSNGANPLVLPGIVLARAVCRVRGADRAAVLLEALSTGPFNKAFEPGATGKEWLSRDPAVSRAYVDDPLCGFPCPNSFFLELLRLLAATWKGSAEARLPKALPVLMLAGTADPVSAGGKGVRALAARYRRLGLADLTERHYEGARHELFNETNRDEVFRDLLAWLDARLPAPAQSV